MSFKNIPVIYSEYRSKVDDVINTFYVPCLKESKTYKRATAYFSSSILIHISKGLAAFASNGGKIQLLVSPNLSSNDYKAIEDGYDLRQRAIEVMDKNFDESIDIEQKNDRFTLLSYLIEKNILDIKVAIPTSENSKALFHEKLGIMSDELNNIIAFSGSANETEQAFTDNYETIDVFCDWKSDDSFDRCVNKDRRFDNMWSGDEHGLVVIDFPTVIKQKIIKYNKYDQTDFASLDVNLKELSIKKALEDKYPKLNPEGLYDYQNEAIESWVNNNYQSCLTLATGTGKTFIGCGAIARLFKEKKKLVVFICCPYTHLVDQWNDEVKKFNIEPVVYNDYDSVKRKLTKVKTGRSKFACVITTNSSFMLPKIQSLLSINIADTLLLVDEAHNFGAPGISKFMDDRIPYRLALSATLERHGDPKGTERILNYFGRVTFDYPLERAIIEGKLTKYYYYPIPVYLNADEFDRYQALTERINKFHYDSETGIPDALKALLIKRSRILAETKDKLRALEECLEKYKESNNLLIYCGAVKYENDVYDQEDIRQIDEVRALLRDKLNIVAAKFTSEETTEERREIIRAYKDEELQALVAIKCLDEGVNVPAIKTAFILASSTNPKEYIQRRGRVLRKYPGKRYAEIYDFITLPRSLGSATMIPDSLKNMERSLVKKEFIRLQDFAALSENPSDSNSLMDKIKQAYDMDVIEKGEESL